MCPNEPWPALRLPPFTSETRSRRSFHSAVTSCLSRQIVHSNIQENIHDQLTCASMHLIVKPSEEKLPQVEETDVDVAAEELGKSIQTVAKGTTMSVHTFERALRSIHPKALYSSCNASTLSLTLEVPSTCQTDIRMQSKCRCHKMHQFSSICEGASTKSRATLVPWKREN